MGSNLLICFFFCGSCFGVLRNFHQALGPEDVLLFSSKTIIVLCFTFKFMIEFELFFYKVWNSGQGSYFGLWMFSCSHTICWKDYSFCIELLLHLCEKAVVPICVRLFLDSLFCSIDPCIRPSANTTLSWLL